MLDEDLNEDPPDRLAYLWAWFVELNSCRQSNGYGSLPISHLEICAWQTLSQRQLEKWEVGALRRLDQAYLVQESERTKRMLAK